MPYQAIGHAAVPDPTKTFCVVEGCRRFLHRGDPNQHARGEASKRRYMGHIEQTIPGPPPRKQPWPRPARSPRIPTPPPAPALPRTPAAPPSGNERLDLLAAEVRRLREDVLWLISIQPPTVRINAPGWQANRPDRQGRTRT
jgi:hypothetical protein